MGRLIIVSNRLPVTVHADGGGGEPTVARSPGGLATGLSGPHESSEGLWVGWPGDLSTLGPEQQFFLGYAHAWCSKDRPEATRMRTATNPHSPPVLRVNVPMRNFAPFAQAFSCREGDRMVSPPANRCEVW